MSLKNLRKDKHLSQEDLAEVSGLGLRTIQRVERGHRVSFASLRALAAALEISVDDLEIAIYSTDDLQSDSANHPAVVRYMFGNGNWNSVARRTELVAIERILLVAAAFFLCLWAASVIWDLSNSTTYFLRKTAENGTLAGSTGVLQLIGAYLTAKQIAIGDRYDIWSRLDPSQPRSIFPHVRERIIRLFTT